MSKNKDRKPPNERHLELAVNPALQSRSRFVTVLVQWMIAIAVLAYVGFRVLALDVTNDEWGSLKSIYHKGVPDLITFKYVDAQSHFAQSLLSIIFLKVFPASHEVAAMRIPSLIGLLIYLYAAFRIVSLIPSHLLSIAGFVALCTNAYVLDFFGLARGYGLSLGFMLFSLWQVMAIFVKPALPPSPRTRSNLAVWSACLAVLSNLAWLNFFGAVCLLLLWAAFKDQRSGDWSNRAWRALVASQNVIYTTCLLAVFYLPRVILLREQGSFYFGGVDGFVQDTVQSLVKAAMYVSGGRGDPVYTGCAYGIFAVSAIVSIVSLVRVGLPRQWEQSSVVQASAVISAVLVLSYVVTMCLYVLFDVRFVMERAALGFLILAVCQVVVFAASVRWPWRIPAIAVLILYVAGGTMHLNVVRTCNWQTNSEIREFVTWLGEARAQNGRHLIVGTDADANYTMWYYLETLLGLTESEETKAGIGFVRIFNGVTIYSLNLPGDKSLFDENTDYLLLRHKDRPGRYPKPVRLIKEYRSAACDLFACEKGPAVNQATVKPFSGAVYPVRFDRQ